MWWSTFLLLCRFPPPLFLSLSLSHRTTTTTPVNKHPSPTHLKQRNQPEERGSTRIRKIKGETKGVKYVYRRKLLDLRLPYFKNSIIATRTEKWCLESCSGGPI
ncbi:hypothetical protein Hanom_Chr10g00908021 [Helianthus anomalus]